MNTIMCPVVDCPHVLDLTPRPDDGTRSIGTCICGRFGGRAVVEVDAPAKDRPYRSEITSVPDDELDANQSELIDLPGVSIEIVDALRAVGLDSIGLVDAASDETLLAVSGIGPVTLKKIRAEIARQHTQGA